MLPPQSTQTGRPAGPCVAPAGQQGGWGPREDSLEKGQLQRSGWGQRLPLALRPQFPQREGGGCASSCARVLAGAAPGGSLPAEPTVHPCPGGARSPAQDTGRPSSGHRKACLCGPSLGLAGPTGVAPEAPSRPLTPRRACPPAAQGRPGPCWPCRGPALCPLLRAGTCGASSQSVRLLPGCGAPGRTRESGCLPEKWGAGAAGLGPHCRPPPQMPVCSYFLKGICSNSDCPYSHVYVSRKAEVCTDFLKGYCPLGAKVSLQLAPAAPVPRSVRRCPSPPVPTWPEGGAAELRARRGLPVPDAQRQLLTRPASGLPSGWALRKRRLGVGEGHGQRRLALLPPGRDGSGPEWTGHLEGGGGVGVGRGVKHPRS